MKRKQYAGFTIVEILIVIAILALLATIISFSYSAQQRESRDEKRRADMIALEHELEQYYDKNGNYPLSCDHGNTSSTSCSSVTSAYTSSYGAAPPTIGKDSTVANIRVILPGLRESFGDPLGDNAPPVNQHASGGGGHNIDRRSYLFFSLDMSNTSTTARLSTDASGGSSLNCEASPYQYDYRGTYKGNRSHPYVLGYYSEVERKWIFIHGPKLDIMNDLRWNYDNKAGCTPTTL